MGKYLLVMFTNPVEGREDEFNTWYNTQHLQDVVDLPGFSSAQRFKKQIPMMGEQAQQHLALYDLDAATLEEAGAALKGLTSPSVKMSDSLDLKSMSGGLFEMCGPETASPSGKAAGTFRVVAMSNAVDGREADFNTWYNNVHMREVTAIPGFTDAKRYELKIPLGAPLPNKYIAVYGMEANDMAGAGGTLQQMGQTKLELTDAMSQDGGVVGVFEASSPRVTASKEKSLA